MAGTMTGSCWRRGSGVGLIVGLLLTAATACGPQAVTITLKAAPSTSVVAGRAVRLSGTVRPARAGGRIIIERLVGRTWVQRASGPLSNRSTYAIAIRPSQAGTYKLRARRAASATDRAAISPTLTLTVAADPGRVPSAVPAPTASGGDAKALVAWTAPSDTGGSPITRYDVTADPSGTTLAATSSPVTFTGLTNGVAYRFRVRACNATGCGSFSEPSNAVVPSGVPAGQGVAISKGPSVSTSGCFDSSCAYVHVRLSGLPGVHAVQCFGEGTAFFTYSTSSPDSEVCYYGYPGHDVYVVVDGSYVSNHLTW